MSGQYNETYGSGAAAPALAPVHEHQQQHQHYEQGATEHPTSYEVHATDFGAMNSGHATPATHHTSHHGTFPPGDPVGPGAPLSATHHPAGIADPLTPFYPGARRSKQQMVTGLGRAMPTYEEMQLKKAAEKRRREGHDAPGAEGMSRQNTSGPGTAAALDSITDPNLRVVLSEILHALGGHQHGMETMTPYTMSPPLSRINTHTAGAGAGAAQMAPLSRVGTVRTVRTVAEAEQILAPFEEDPIPNPLKRMTNYIREPAAEFLGTALILLFGNGVNQQFFLSFNENVSGVVRGTYLSVSFGWGIGVMVGVYVAGGISGAHLNPAVTLSLAVFRGFSWKKVVPFWIAQVLGAMTGSGIVHLLYSRATSIYQGGPNIRTILGPNSTGGLYVTTPLAYMSVAASFFNEFVDTAILICFIFAIGDSNNTPPPDGVAPLVLLFIIVGIGACLGSQTAYAINPARDFGPRLMLWMAGYGTEIWTAFNWYWIWCPIAAPLCGCIAGGLVYDLFLYKGLESPLNKRWEWPGSKKHKALKQQREMEQHPQAPLSINDSNEKMGKAEHV